MQDQEVPDPGITGPSFEKDVSAWPQLKISRAIQHIKDLEGRIAVWSSGKPFTTEAKITEDRLRWQTKLRVFSPPPLFEWSLIAGDCFHALRTSLDACVWELAHLNGTSPPKPNLLQFPILEDGGSWEKAKRERLQTVPDEIAARIQILQPFNRPPEEVGRDPLICLNRLDIVDKHRSSIGVSIKGARIKGGLRVGWVDPGAAERNLPPRLTYYTPEITDGAVVMELLSQDPIASVQGGCEIGFQFTVETPTGRQELFGLAGTLIQYIQQVHVGLLGGFVKKDTVIGSEVDDATDWQHMDMAQEGDVYRSVHKP